MGWTQIEKAMQKEQRKSGSQSTFSVDFRVTPLRAGVFGGRHRLEPRLGARDEVSCVLVCVEMYVKETR